MVKVPWFGASVQRVRRSVVAVGVVSFALLATGQDSCEVEEPQPQEREQQPDDEPSRPDPSGDSSLNCDYLLGDFTEGSEQGYRFVAGGTVKNTGNIGIVTRVTARWQLLGSSPIVERRAVRLRPGRTRQVQITRLASQNEIDAHQSADGNCSAKATIVDTFGRPQE